MTDKEGRILRAVTKAMTSVETGTALKPEVVRILLDEIVRQRRVLETQERTIRRLERRCGHDDPD